MHEKLVEKSLIMHFHLSQHVVVQQNEVACVLVIILHYCALWKDTEVHQLS